MQNKIFNAIQKGLINALVFDEDDSSISYQKSNINNEMNFPKVSLEELYRIFKKDSEDIFKYNTKDCLSLILDNGKEISLYEYKYDREPIFLKIVNEKLKNSGNDIIIACDNKHCIAERLVWQTEREQILPHEYLTKSEQAAINDFDGYLKTQIILDTVKNNPQLGDIPAIKYCDELLSPVDGYKGYLPTIGQLLIIMDYLDMVNYVFEQLKFDTLNLMPGIWWSSQEEDSHNAWYLYNGNTTFPPFKNYTNITSTRVQSSFQVLPLFTLKN